MKTKNLATETQSTPSQAIISRLEEMANRMAAMMREYDLPEECNGIIAGELDATNEVLETVTNGGTSSQMPARVVKIEVLGGVAYLEQCPADVTVEIRDLDNESTGH